MAETEMKQKVAKGLFWKLLENGGAQGVQFIIAILLARLLTPAEYGVVGIIMIFITIANVFVQSGFSTALVQKRTADEVDFSSVCYFELAAALGMSRSGDFCTDGLCVPEHGIPGPVFFHPGGISGVRRAEHCHGSRRLGRVGDGRTADQLLHQSDGSAVSDGFLEAAQMLFHGTGRRNVFLWLEAFVRLPSGYGF